MPWLDWFRIRKIEEAVSYKDNLVYLVDQALDQAEQLIDSDPLSAFQRLKHANQLYNHFEDNYGFNFDRHTRLNDLCFTYIRRCLTNSRNFS